MDPSATERLLPSGNSDSSVDPESNDLNQDIKEFENALSRALNNALQGSAQLANMLPTGTVLFFQMLDPILSTVGSCRHKNLSAAFLIICSFVCFILTFTDSFQASNGKVYYGFATFKGLWTPQLKTLPSGTDLSKYKIKFADFVHALLAVFAFFTTTTFSSDVVSCFFKIPSAAIRAAPTVSGFLISAVFLIFPSSRHGVGFPLSPAPSSSAAAAGAAPAPAPAPGAGAAPAAGAGAGAGAGAAPAPAPAAPAAATGAPAKPIST